MDDGNRVDCRMARGRAICYQRIQLGMLNHEGGCDMGGTRRWLTSVLAIAGLSGCAIFHSGAYTNHELKAGDRESPAQGQQADFKVRESRVAPTCEKTTPPPSDPKKQKDVLVLLALSGGGSRAAYFSSLAMLEMQRQKVILDESQGSETDLLHEVDAISSVSGGSLAGAYYAISYDPGQECAAKSKRKWDAKRVEALMTRDYLSRWVGNWFWPVNVVRYWLTDFDRTDIMAQTFADNLFDKWPTGGDLKLADLNPLRPNLILNSTSGTVTRGGTIHFGDVFTFTHEDFLRICASASSYSVARAVMASATFPGAFNFMTLRDYYPDCDSAQPVPMKSRSHYLHVFDGGNSDNLGLTSLRRVIWESLIDRDGEPQVPDKDVVVILVDAFIQSPGADPWDSDARASLDFLIDMNFIDATDSLLEKNRERLIAQFRDGPLFPFGSAQDGSPTRESASDACMRFFHGVDHGNCEKPQDWWKKLNLAISQRLKFVELNFAAVPDVIEGCDGDRSCLRDQLNRIGTSFKFHTTPNPKTGLTDSEAIACAVPALFGRAGDEDAKEACKGLRLADVLGPPATDWAKVRAILQNPGPQDHAAMDDVE